MIYLISKDYDFVMLLFSVPKYLTSQDLKLLEYRSI